MIKGGADHYYWRVFATALGFLAFGLGALFLTLVAFPMLFLLPQGVRAEKARWCIHKCFAAFMWTVERLGLMNFEVSGREHLRNCGSHIILANHPTLIDVVALIALIPNASCVVKQALWRNPFMGAVVRCASYISNAEPERVIDECVAEVQLPRPLIIFPEGTRSILGRKLQFQRGAAYITLRSGKPFLPVLIHCEPRTLTKGAAWYRIPKRKFTLHVNVLPAMGASALIGETISSPLQARRLTAAFESFFTGQLTHHGYTNLAET